MLLHRRSAWTIFYLLCALFLSANYAHAFTEPLENSFKVALIDKFYPGDDAFETQEEQELDAALYGMLDIDGDRKREPLYHGDLVRVILQHPLIEVLPYELERGENSLQGLLRNLEELRRDIFWGEQIDAVVLPWESSTLLSAFSDGAVSDRHVDEYLDIVYQWSDSSEVWRTTWDIILVLEDIIQLGGQVFTIAGNGGPRMINTYSFAKGIITVGAYEPELKHFISDNSLVDMHEQAFYQANRVDDAQGNPVGYDISGNGCADIPLDLLTSDSQNLPKRYWKPLKGSSFAAPMAAKKALVGEVGSLFCYSPKIARR